MEGGKQGRKEMGIFGNPYIFLPKKEATPQLLSPPDSNQAGARW